MTTTTDNTFGPRVIEFEGGEYQVCTGNGGSNNPPFFWLAGKRGWLPPTRDNVRFRSRFRSRRAAESAIAQAGDPTP